MKEGIAKMKFISIGRWGTRIPAPIAITFAAVLLAAGCGGGGSDQPTPPEQPGQPDNPGVPPPPKEFKPALLSGAAVADLNGCASADGPLASARFSRLSRATAYKDAVYLTETGEGCANVDFIAPGFVPRNIQPAIRKISGGSVETALRLNQYDTALPHPVMVRYPSGFFRSETAAGGFVLAYAVANSDRRFEFDSAELARYTQHGGWNYYVPGLFKLTDARAGYGDLVAGMPGSPPHSSDGLGRAAGFTAPHNLEKDAAGVFHVIDDGQIRTIGPDYQVKTLDLAALGITGAVKALDSDRQGNIHVLEQVRGPLYRWHRLSDGSKLDFATRAWQMTEPITVETIAVVGKELLLSIRHPSGFASLYRVAANGEVKSLTGLETPRTPQDFLDQPSQFLLPAVQHIEYGADGHLYIVLPQGVLIVRDYT